MKTSRSLLAASLALLAFLAVSAHAVTLYPTEDTSSTIDFSTGKNPVETKSFLTTAAGTAGSLPVSKIHNAFIQFGAANALAGSTVTNATLTIYFPSVTKGGNITLHLVDTTKTPGGWTEIIAKGASNSEPSIDSNVLDSLAVTTADAKQFVTFNVTGTVQAWLAGTPDQGFAFQSDGVLSCLLGAKEGPGSGYPAVLEVDVDNVSNAPLTATTGTFSGSVGINTTTPGAPLDVEVSSSEQGSLIAQFGTAMNPRIKFFDENTSNGNQLGPIINFSAGDGAQITGGGSISLMPGNGNGVGIGTLTPGSLLEVNGTAQIDSTLNVTGKLTASATSQLVGPVTSNSGITVTGGGLTVTPTGSDAAVTISQSTTLTPGTSKTYAFEVNQVTPVFARVAIGADDSGGHIQTFPSIVNLPSTTPLPLLLNDAGGNVGIGTATPGSLLEVNGAAKIDGTLTGAAASFSSNVGIGTTNPTQALLVVNGTAQGSETSAYTDYTRDESLNFPAGTILGALSIFASDTVAAEQYEALSDERIKNIQGRSDNAADLHTLREIEVTDYHFKDVIARGNRPQKKVIAQQVEKVYPQAVNLHTDVVPDIYEKATVQDGWVSLGTDLQVGERVRLIGEKEEGIYQVLEIDDGMFRTAFHPATDKIFVFGREVNDFRTVDYEAIAMLNVSATQELARKVEAKDAEIAALNTKVAAVEAKDREREARLIRLENALEAQSNRPVTASLRQTGY